MHRMQADVEGEVAGAAGRRWSSRRPSLRLPNTTTSAEHQQDERDDGVDGEGGHAAALAAAAALLLRLHGSLSPAACGRMQWESGQGRSEAARPAWRGRALAAYLARKPASFISSRCVLLGLAEPLVEVRRRP